MLRFPVAHVLLVFLTVYGIMTEETDFFSVLWNPQTEAHAVIIAGFFAFLVSCWGPLFALHSSQEEKKIRRKNRGTQILALL